jgi:hypothetical protein
VCVCTLPSAPWPPSSRPPSPRTVARSTSAQRSRTGSCNGVAASSHLARCLLRRRMVSVRRLHRLGYTLHRGVLCGSVARRLLSAAYCCMSHAACNMQHATCLHATYRMQQYAACRTLRAACHMVSVATHGDCCVHTWSLVHGARCSRALSAAHDAAWRALRVVSCMASVATVMSFTGRFRTTARRRSARK